MWSLLVAELDVAGEVLPDLFRSGIFVQIHLLIFDSFPKPLGEDVVYEPPSSVHTDLHSRLHKQARVLRADELAPLVGVLNGGCGCTQGHSCSFHHEVLFHALVQLPAVSTCVPFRLPLMLFVNFNLFASLRKVNYLSFT